jgi:hypothetical protein
MTPPTREPTREPMREPTREPTREPMRALMREPVREPTREPCRRSKGRGNSSYRSSRSYKSSPTGNEDQTMMSRSTRPTDASSRSFEPRVYDLRKDVPPSVGGSGDGDGGGGGGGGVVDQNGGGRRFIDPSTLKRQFWSKGHPRFKCREDCDHSCVTTAPPGPEDGERRRQRCDAGPNSDTVQRPAGKSSLAQDMDIHEATLKLNLEMLEPSKIDDGEKESRRDDGRRGSKRRHLALQSTDGRATRRRRKNDDSDHEDCEAEATLIRVEETDEQHSSASSSKRSKTLLSRQDKNSDCSEDHRDVSDVPRMIYDDMDVVDRCSPRKTGSVSTDGTEHSMALQPSRRSGGLGGSGGTLSVASAGSGRSEVGRISRESGVDDEGFQALKGVSTMRMSTSTVHTCRQMLSASASATNPSSAAAAVTVNLLRSSVTYVTEILQTSNFSTHVCVEKYKKLVN